MVINIEMVDSGSIVFAIYSAIYYILFGYGFHYMMECAKTLGIKEENTPDFTGSTKTKKRCPHVAFLLCVSFTQTSFHYRIYICI